MKVVTNGYIFQDKRGIKRLFAEVVEDDRYEKGHHIVTSMIISAEVCNDEIQYAVVKTENETVYQVNHLLTKEEFISYVKENFDEERANWYLFCANLD